MKKAIFLTFILLSMISLWYMLRVSRMNTGRDACKIGNLYKYLTSIEDYKSTYFMLDDRLKVKYSFQKFVDDQKMLLRIRKGAIRKQYFRREDSQIIDLSFGKVQYCSTMDVFENGEYPYITEVINVNGKFIKGSIMGDTFNHFEKLEGMGNLSSYGEEISKQAVQDLYEELFKIMKE